MNYVICYMPKENVLLGIFTRIKVSLVGWL